MLLAHHVTLPAVNKDATSNGVLKRAQQKAGFNNTGNNSQKRSNLTNTNDKLILLSFQMLIYIRLH